MKAEYNQPLGDSLWSAAARRRFGSPLRFPGNDWKETYSGLLSLEFVESGGDYQSGVEPPHSKGSADLCIGSI
jgi:hypothetical protein